MIKKLKYLSIGLAFIIVAIALTLYVAHSTKTAHNNKRIITAAVNDIKLPEQFQLVSSKYVDEACLDVCANTLLTYRPANGGQLDKNSVVLELENQGYVYESNYFYTKTYYGKKVHVTVNSGNHHEMSIDVSL